MSFSEDEIITEMSSGKVYTEKEVLSFIEFHNGNVIITDVRQLHENGDKKFKVTNIVEGYLHYREDSRPTPNYNKYYIMNRTYE
ncbi:hypothetical protein GCM10008983_06460 [Lentibacillus halophilus]|uniref:Uncharacterized protein n=1 Tax=Lentibacillus halophilus TaxID=295065 RepID=A0ABN0Z4M8_9BACI